MDLTAAVREALSQYDILRRANPPKKTGILLRYGNSARVVVEK
jgi:hypothetical protein